MRRILSTLMVATMLGSVTGAGLIAAPTAAAEMEAAEMEVAPGDYLLGAWELYRSRFMAPEGRIVDGDNGSISHSEGQGYGMLIAVAANDRASFEQLWSWTQGHLLVRDDGLAAWKWDPAAKPEVSDTNNATDGDLLIAWALLRAARQWDRPEFLIEARAIVDAVVKRAVVDSRFGPILLPAAEGFGEGAQPDGPVVNLSYWIFPAIAELEEISPALASANLNRAGLRLAAEARFGKSKLPSDWTGTGGDKLAPAEGFAAEFGYNAIRVPLYLAWFSSGYADLVGDYSAAWQTDAQAVPAVVDLSSDTIRHQMGDPGYRALADLVDCSLHRIETAGRAKAFEPTSYYPSTIHLLSLMALAERYPQCL